MTETGGRQDRRILFALWLLMFAASSQVMVIAPLLSSIGQALGVSMASLGHLMTVYAATVGVFALVAGPISDRVGRRRVLLWGSVLMTFALALHGVAGSYLSLLAFRTLAGVAGGILSGAIVAFVGDYFPGDRRGWANGWVMTGLAAGQILGVPAGTLLAELSGYRAPFVALAGVSTLAALAVFVLVPHVPTASGRLTLGSVLRGYRSLLNRRSTFAATATYVAVFFGIATFMLFLPTWLEAELGFTASRIAVLYLIGGVGTV
ncbi:MAG: MFS transporter, partial [Acidobacteriota bacterium]